MNILIITIIYIIFVIGELYLLDYYIKYNTNKTKERDDNFKKGNKERDIFICNEVTKRVEKLKTMSYSDWLNYNRQNVVVPYKDMDFVIFVSQKSLTKDLTIQRVTFFDKYNDMNEKIFQEFISDESAYFSQHNIYKGINDDMYNLTELSNGCIEYSYLWVDQFDKNYPIIKKSIAKKYVKEENGQKITGVIGMGYSKSEIYDNSIYYYEIVYNYFLLILYLFIYFLFFVNYFLIKKPNITKTFILCFLLNLYATFTLSSKDIITTPSYEEKKVVDLNSSILGISFLVAANIFVIQSLKNDKIYKSLYNETAFLFCCSLIALMIAMFKINNFEKVTDIKTHRVENQIFFNMSIIINIFIFINYFIFISSDNIKKSISKITQLISSTFTSFRN